MTFTVASGTSSVGATSYISVEFADDYHNLRLSPTWSGSSTEAKQASLIKATEYIDNRFYNRFKGIQAEVEGLQFPRAENSACYDDGTEFDYYPAALKKATAEYALSDMESSNYVSPDDMFISSYSRSLGSASESVTYAGSNISGFRKNPTGDNIIKILFDSDRIRRK